MAFAGHPSLYPTLPPSGAPLPCGSCSRPPPLAPGPLAAAAGAAGAMPQPLGSAPLTGPLGGPLAGPPWHPSGAPGLAGASAGPHQPWPFAPASAAAAQPLVPYEVVQQQVTDRINTAERKRLELLGHLDELTDGYYNENMKNKFSEARKAGLDGVDWRVPRLMYCKDPKHNVGVNPAAAFEVHQRKVADAEVLEQQLAQEACDRWAQALSVVGKSPPPLEMVRGAPVPFAEAVPNYCAHDDVWARTLELRTLDEAMRGDVSMPLPRPAIHTEEYQNFQEGRYIKDDCPIA